MHTDIAGSRGRRKKRLEVEEKEAMIVRHIYDLYLNGHQGRTMGIKEIVKYLTERGQLMRGSPWSIQKMHEVLSSRAYLGEHYFNVRNSKTGEMRPPADWIMVKAEPIIEAQTFERAAALREARSKKFAAALRHLLTGLLKCSCGHHITAVTGKSGRYHYYKCAARQSKGNHACTSRNYPMDKLDTLILQQLADKVCAPERRNTLMAELRKRTRNSKDAEQQQIGFLSKQLAKSEQAQPNLLTAIENGLPFDEVTQKRSQDLKAERESLLVELAGVRHSVTVPVDRILPSNIGAFSKAVCETRTSPGRYLQVLVEEIVV